MSAKTKSLLAIKISEKISKISLYLLVFLFPIFFLPWTTDVLDFNKQALLIVLVFISLFCWLFKAVTVRRLALNLNRISLPVIALFFIFLLSTIFSLWRYGSFWGWPQIISESLLTLLGLTLFYFLVINIFEKKEIFYLMVLFISSCFLAMLYGILQIFSKFLVPFDFAKINGFNTIGTVNGLAVFIAILLPLFTTLFVITKKIFLKILFLFSIVIGIFLLFLINFQIAWWLVIIGSALEISLGIQKKELSDSRFLILPMLFLACALFFSLFGFRPTGIPSLTPSVTLDQKVSFDISLKALKEKPIFGSGPGTFVYNFSKYKDVNFNQSPFWSIRFQGGASRILSLLGTVGILGVISFLALIGVAAFLGIKSIFSFPKILLKEEGPFLQLAVGIFISFITLSIGYFLYQSNLSLDFLFFFLIAGFISLVPSNKKEFLLRTSSFVTLGTTFAFTIIFIFGLGILILGAQKYLAETNYLNGLKAWQEGNFEETLIDLERAVKLDPKMDLYWRELSQVYLQEINTTIKKTDLSREELTRQLQLFVSAAINAAKKASDINPKNVANFSVQGFVYQNLIGIVDGTTEWAVKSYEQAILLEPANPYFPSQAGISLLKKASSLSDSQKEEKQQLFSEAQEYFNKSLELKNDYAPAHFQLAMIYQMQGENSEAIGELEKAKNSAPFDIGLAFQLGLVYYQGKDYQKAKLELERAISLDSNYANALYFLGLTYDQLGDKNKAIEKFQKVSDLNPDNAEVKKILENLKAGKKALSGIVEEVPPEVPIEEKHPEIEK